MTVLTLGLILFATTIPANSPMKLIELRKMSRQESAMRSQSLPGLHLPMVHPLQPLNPGSCSVNLTHRHYEPAAGGEPSIQWLVCGAHLIPDRSTRYHKMISLTKKKKPTGAIKHNVKSDAYIIAYMEKM
ncbi:hypothetical protein ElyMa_002470900 [Elysia marginata]|uniref:Uncharacterized protein n=1 Tax=Elysia marginata TaxID=1093978 RepID=A0AAV4GMP3_9GAST|nr:hypothetical protein ElyMa_002470900 [Elysia marginata]